MPAPNKVDHDRVRQLLAQGLTARQIAERLGIHKGSVHAIQRQAAAEAKS